MKLKKILHILFIKPIFNLKWFILDTWNTKKFLKHKIQPKTVLIVEPNPYHGEILPGFVKYFQDTGYTVELMLRYENSAKHIFSRFSIKPSIYQGTALCIKKLLQNAKIRNYDFVFISSSAFLEEGVFSSSYLEFLGFIPKAKYGIMIVEHTIDPFLKKFKEDGLLKNKRLFTLSGFQNTPILNPHFFGDKIKITPKSNDKTRFIVVGGINKYCKNHDLLFSSANTLINKNFNFEIVIIGRGKLKIPRNLKNHIIHKGGLNSSDMYTEMEKADFFLPLLDSSIKDHLRYTKGTTSGSRQLGLGFQKPMIIDITFAKPYNLDDTNSICYRNNDLTSGMIKAIRLSQKNYFKIQNQIKILSNKIYNKSLKNLKDSIQYNEK